MSWIYKDKLLLEEDIPTGAIGFIYGIKNNVNGMKYIGRKLLTKAPVKAKPSLKTPKPKKKPRVKSNYDSYYGSCTDLTEDIKVHGKENMTRTILQFCNSAATMTYGEKYAQYRTKCLERADYYNSNIGNREYKRNIFNKINDSSLEEWIVTC